MGYSIRKYDWMKSSEGPILFVSSQSRRFRQTHRRRFSDGQIGKGGGGDLFLRWGLHKKRATECAYRNLSDFWPGKTTESSEKRCLNTPVNFTLLTAVTRSLPGLIAFGMYAYTRTAARRSVARSPTAACSSRALSNRALTARIIATPRQPFASPRRQLTSDAFRAHLDSVPSPAEAVGEPAVDQTRGKVWESADEAVKDLKSGSLVLSAGTSAIPSLL